VSYVAILWLTHFALNSCRRRRFRYSMLWNEHAGVYTRPHVLVTPANNSSPVWRHHDVIPYTARVTHRRLKHWTLKPVTDCTKINAGGWRQFLTRVSRTHDRPTPVLPYLATSLWRRKLHEKRCTKPSLVCSLCDIDFTPRCYCVVTASRIVHHSHLLTSAAYVICSV